MVCVPQVRSCLLRCAVLHGVGRQRRGPAQGDNANGSHCWSRTFYSRSQAFCRRSGTFFKSSENIPLNACHRLTGSWLHLLSQCVQKTPRYPGTFCNRCWIWSLSSGVSGGASMISPPDRTRTFEWFHESYKNTRLIFNMCGMDNGAYNNVLMWRPRSEGPNLLLHMRKNGHPETDHVIGRALNSLRSSNRVRAFQPEGP